MRRLLILAAFLLTIAHARAAAPQPQGSIEPEPEPETDPSFHDESIDATRPLEENDWIVQVNPRLPKYRMHFRVKHHSNYVEVRSVEVFRGSERHPWQILRERYDDTLCWPPRHEDMNFDGYEDLVFPVGCGNGAGFADYWLFQPATGRFQFNKTLSQMSQVKRYPKAKVVTSHYYGGGADHTEQVYRWVRGRLTLMSREDETQKDDHLVEHSVWVRRRGKWSAPSMRPIPGDMEEGDGASSGPHTKYNDYAKTTEDVFAKLRRLPLHEPSAEQVSGRST